MKKTIKLVGLFILFILTRDTYGQTSKTYSGNFNTTNFQGIAIYQYYEDSAEQRVFDGNFSFVAQNKSATITGSYSNNLKNGNWKISLTNVASSDLLMKYVITANVSGTFKNGSLDGTWSLKRTKVISFSHGGISQMYQSKLNQLSYLFDGNQVDFNKTTTETESSIANFKDNHFIGAFKYSINEGKSEIQGQFDDNGYCDGKWIVTCYKEGIQSKLVRTYQNGLLLSIKEIDNSTGDIKIMVDNRSSVTAFFKNYNSAENISCDTNYGGLHYTNCEKLASKLEENKSDKEDDIFLNDAISMWYNNVSLSNSAGAYELERGSYKMVIYPERIRKFDFVKTKELTKRQEVIQQSTRSERERKVSNYARNLNQRWKLTSSPSSYIHLIQAIDERYKQGYDNGTLDYFGMTDRYGKMYNILMSMSDSDFKTFWSNFNLEDKSTKNIVKIETALLSK